MLVKHKVGNMKRYLVGLWATERRWLLMHYKEMKDMISGINDKKVHEWISFVMVNALSLVVRGFFNALRKFDTG